MFESRDNLDSGIERPFRILDSFDKNATKKCFCFTLFGLLELQRNLRNTERSLFPTTILHESVLLFLFDDPPSRKRRRKAK